VFGYEGSRFARGVVFCSKLLSDPFKKRILSLIDDVVYAYVINIIGYKQV
jgi:hypothetical protein